MKRIWIVLPALLCAALLCAHAVADDDEQERRLREEKLALRMEQAFGPDWRERVAVYEDYDLGYACEDGTLFAITTDERRSVLHVVEYVSGEIVSHIENPHGVYQDALPEFAFELENEMGLAYDDLSGDWHTFARDTDGRWVLRFYRAANGKGGWLDVTLTDAPSVEYSVDEDGQARRIAAYPAFATDIAEVDVKGLPRDEQSLLLTLLQQ